MRRQNARLLRICMLSLLLPVFIGSTAACICDDLPVSEHENKISGTYLVTFTNDSTTQDTLPAGVSAEAWRKSQVPHLRTCVVNLTEQALAGTRSACNVAYIETDAFGEFILDEEGDASVGSAALSRRASVLSFDWPLSAMSQPQPNGKSAEEIEVDVARETRYYYAQPAGKGVDVYIIDSGINHFAEFLDPVTGEDRLVDELDASDENSFADTGNRPRGHGTGVASVIGGLTNGAAKRATLRTVKITQQGVPSLGSFVRAVREITRRHNRRKRLPGFKGSVINISAKLEASDAAFLALTAAYAAGISLVAAAGNRGYDPNTFPCVHAYVICVGAATSRFQPWYDGPGKASNWGPAVDIWAPGHDVPHFAADGSSGALRKGTSKAAGFTTGVLAVIMSLENSGVVMTPGRARGLLMRQASYIMEFPEIPGVDWGTTPTKAFLNTGFRKGQALQPKRAYLGGPAYTD